MLCTVFINLNADGLLPKYTSICITQEEFLVGSLAGDFRYYSHMPIVINSQTNKYKKMSKAHIATAWKEIDNEADIVRLEAAGWLGLLSRE